jgi:hypothetical protein
MAKRERNAVIITLLKKGRSVSDLASQFNLSPGRVRQIAISHEPLERRRSQLKKKYGPHPRIDKLPDDTPVDVLILCKADIHHWEARVGQLHDASMPIRTLGDLRSTTRPRLLREPRIGARMVAELRAHCPFRRGRNKLNKRSAP